MLSLFSYVCWSSAWSPLEKCLFKSFTHCLIWLFILLMLKCKCFLYIFWVLTPYWSYNLLYFLPVCRSSFHFIDSFFCYEKRLNLIKFHLSIFALVSYAFRDRSWEILLCCSVAKSCLTLCDPMDGSTLGFPVLHHFPEFTQTHVHWVGDAIQASHPLSSPSPPGFNLSQDQGLFQWVGSSHQVAKVLHPQLQHQFFQWVDPGKYCYLC